MLRSLGYQSRVVFGYLPHYDEKSGIYQISGRDAHAWTEVLFTESGWVQFDPSPLNHVGAAPDAPTPQTPVSGSDPGDALTVPPPSRPGNARASQPPSASRPASEPEGNGFTPGSLIIIIAAIIVSLVVVTIIAIPAVKAARASRRKRAGDVRSRVAEAWREVTGRLADVGLPIHSGHTGGEVTAVVRNHLTAQVSSSVADLVRMHEAAAFAPAVPDRRDADRAWTIVAVIRRQLRHELPPGRRLRAQLSLASLRNSQR
jgi:hypothetical protein